MDSAGELLFMSGEAPTANETIATIAAANAPAPRPCLKVLPVGCSTQNYLLAYVFALTKSRCSSAGSGGVRNRHQSRASVEEAQGNLGKVRLASAHRFRSRSAKCYDSDAPFGVLGLAKATGPASAAVKKK